MQPVHGFRFAPGGWTAAAAMPDQGASQLLDPGSPAAPGPPPLPHRQAPLLQSSLVTNLVAAFFLIFIFGWNMASVSSFSMPRIADPIAYGFGVYQRWDMFAPQPPRFTTWYVYQGTLLNGRTVDVLRPIAQDDLDLIADVSWTQPENIATDLYGDKYWRKYLGEIVNRGKGKERAAFTAYVCQAWNAHYAGSDQRLSTIDFYAVFSRTLPSEQQGTPDGAPDRLQPMRHGDPVGVRTRPGWPDSGFQVRCPGDRGHLAGRGTGGARPCAPPARRSRFLRFAVGRISPSRRDSAT